MPEDSLPFYSSDVEVAQIVRVAKVSSSQEEEAKNKLLDLRASILKGEDFAALAMKNSEDPSAQYNGGDLGYVGRGAMVPQFEAMAFQLKVGEISLPFESPFGFHILQLLDRRGNEYQLTAYLDLRSSFRGRHNCSGEIPGQFANKIVSSRK
ncbi:MAG: peptidylprolyl isomerase [Cytophagales bacterium]|nr:peptidylprolyl isomerase [Cytophagales bacterium]